MKRGKKKTTKEGKKRKKSNSHYETRNNSSMVEDSKKIKECRNENVINRRCSAEIAIRHNKQNNRNVFPLKHNQQSRTCPIFYCNCNWLAVENWRTFLFVTFVGQTIGSNLKIVTTVTRITLYTVVEIILSFVR